MLSFHVNDDRYGPGRAGEAVRGAGRGRRAFLGLGSNLGDRKGSLLSAVERLERAGVRVASRSSLYRTEPVEVVDQQEFINQAVGCETHLAPDALLEVCLGIERHLGRVRTRD